MGSKVKKLVFFTALLAACNVWAQDQPEVKYYPNPCHDMVHIDVTTHGVDVQKVKLFDLIGVERYSWDSFTFKDEEKFKLQVKNLSAGIYFLNLYSAQGLIGSKKIVCNSEL